MKFLKRAKQTSKSKGEEKMAAAGHIFRTHNSLTKVLLLEPHENRNSGKPANTCRRKIKR